MFSILNHIFHNKDTLFHNYVHLLQLCLWHDFWHIYKKITSSDIAFMDQSDISRLVEAQRTFFRQGRTLSHDYRVAQLRRLEQLIRDHEQALTEALWQDLHKSYEEAYLTELSIVYAEIHNHLKHLRRWMRPRRKPSPVSILPSRSRVITEPIGTTLIIAPWNYPVQLLLNPLVGAISAGCTAVLKPSPYTPHVSQVLTQLIRSAFPEEYIAIVEGHREVNTMLLNERWDLIFFTGSPVLGRTVMAAAARHLTPVVLELGGKSPCIIDCDANLAIAAKRVAWGKALNAGQTCIAPDYLLVQQSVKDEFLRLLAREFDTLLGTDPQQSRHFVRIVNSHAMERLVGYLHDGDIAYGGHYDMAARYLSPTLLTNVSPDAPVMQEEIFGPVFPVLTFNELDEAIRFVTEREKPLALYYFGTQGKHVLRHTSAGGTCINDTIMHIVNHHLPFGGVGNSGMSAYHGLDSYLVFSHRRAVVTTPTCIDMPFRYMPYRLFRFVKRLV